MKIFLIGKSLWEELTGMKANKPDMVNSGNYVLPIPLFIENNACSFLHLAIV